MLLLESATGAKWIKQLWSALKKIRKDQKDELEQINNTVFIDAVELAKYYVEPNCQEVNPADHHEERFLTASVPVMQKINQFFYAKVFQPGDNFLFILSDAGMGKTALLTMLKLMHLTAFMPSQANCILKKLGENTLDDIEKLSEKKDTILLLDSLDEDPTAYGKVKERLLSIIQAVQSFHRIIITCRTQFFPKVDEDPFKRPGLAVIGGYRCAVKYLSLFDDAMVSAYLGKRFRKFYGLFPDAVKIEEAQIVIRKMGSLRCRPMLLAYIEELMTSPLIKENDSEFHVYDTLIESWLNREITKNRELSKENLLQACSILAVTMLNKGFREITESDLDKLIVQFAKIKSIKEIDLKGRSLLNRDGEGHFRFSHYSIQEFLITKLLIDENPVYKPKQNIPLTDFMLRMLSLSNKTPDCIELLDFKGLNLQNVNLKGIHLPGVNLANFDLSMADFNGANLSNANLSNANLSNVNLSNANLSNAILSNANLSNANLSNANLTNADMSNAIILGTNFKWAIFNKIILPSQNLQNADLKGIQLSGINMEKYNLSGADLSQANLSNANLSYANLNNANLSDANLSNANLSYANLEGTIFKGAVLKDIIFPRVKIERLQIEFVYIPFGEFMMGSQLDEIGRNDDEIFHRVRFTKGFFLQTTPITQRQWKAVMGDNPSKFSDCEDCPVETVSWNDVQIFIKKLNEQECEDLYCLPTEAEWEYACRASSTTAYCFEGKSERLDDFTWYCSNSGNITHPVAQKKPNGWGLYDMHGNVWEWCHDWYGSYTDSLFVDPSGVDSKSFKLFRGGSWKSNPHECRSAFRGASSPDYHFEHVGFRLKRYYKTIGVKKDDRAESTA